MESFSLSFANYEENPLETGAFLFKWPVAEIFYVSFAVILNKLSNKQSNCPWFKRRGIRVCNDSVTGWF